LSVDGCRVKALDRQLTRDGRRLVALTSSDGVAPTVGRRLSREHRRPTVGERTPTAARPDILEAWSARPPLEDLELMSVGRMASRRRRVGALDCRSGRAARLPVELTPARRRRANSVGRVFNCALERVHRTPLSIRRLSQVDELEGSGGRRPRGEWRSTNSRGVAVDDPSARSPVDVQSTRRT
jgi:hypothetical protein